MAKIIEKDKQFVANTYARFPLEIVSGKGSIAISSDKKEYIDLGTGIGVTAFGYCDDEWVSAVKKAKSCHAAPPEPQRHSWHNCPINF